MKIKSAELECVCGITSKLPTNTLPEIAFCGKSNVGKSSLINPLVHRQSLARTSQSPGKTQTINFYNLNKELYMVDLPGYGYAQVSKEVREKWGKMIEKYLRTSKMLCAVFLLIDIRHEPSGNDVMMYDWVKSNGYEPIIICTKADKISKGAIQKNLKIIRDKLKCKKDTIMIPFSSQTKQGKEEVYALMDEILQGASQNASNPTENE
ncbi:MAG: YihA family ribosome biogenesis GTP-binding protein [Lachnospiraceae bacterium]|nr:YihA family ribosome biogenesis GTP-binding protein [Lachnospiraceae bacterium]